jgi:1,2-diacylglycerol 3-alpha-glucosyltransferase
LRAELEMLRSELGLEDCIQMPGFKQYNELPSYYASAGAFIHASTTEQWGLVVNEAMASGLPVLVSNRCGCATDLVKEGVNGWTFDPTNEEQIANLMLKISSDEALRSEMGRKSQEIIANWGPDRFASGLKSAVDAALKAPRKKAGLLDRLILWGISRR